jgi:hypothetical protein
MIERCAEGVVCSFGAVRVFDGGSGRMGIMGELVCGERRVLDKLVVGTVGAGGTVANVGEVTITGAAGVFEAAGYIGAVGALEDFGAVVAVDAPGAVGALGDAFP